MVTLNGTWIGEAEQAEGPDGNTMKLIIELDEKTALTLEHLASYKEGMSTDRLAAIFIADGVEAYASEPEELEGTLAGL